jgi:hypothetical protein
MVQKASTPWSTRTVAEGGTDSPVGDLVPIPDKITPVVNTGFISLAGKYRGIPSDDLAFTFQDPSQALAAGADLEFPVNMLNHDIMILAVLDSSGNNINIDIIANNPTTLSGPYTPFADVGVNGSQTWSSNSFRGGGEQLTDICHDTNEDLATTWQFYKILYLRGTQIRLLIHNNEGADAGTISTAYLRLV